MYHPQYAMFFDLHTQKSFPAFVNGFDAASFAEKLAGAGVDLVGFHAKCNQGFCYYNTSTGIRHPSLPEGFDLLGEVIKECGKKNIRVSAYFNCGLSNEDAVQHPEWSKMGMAGNILHPEIYDIGWITPYMRAMCPNTPWRQHLLGMIKEVRDQYPAAGFLFDSFNTFPCICPHCVAGMKKLGLDPSNENDVILFAKRSTLSLAQDISALLEPKKNGLLTFFLGLSSKDNEELGSYLECECLPNNPVWGYDYLPLFARYYRNLAPEGTPILNMSGRFNTWGDFGSLRTTEAIEYDVFFGLANGMRPNIGDHLHPAGTLFDSVFDRVGEVYAKAKQYDPWFRDAENLVDLAVVIPDQLEKTPALVGVTRILSELKIQFDFIDEHCDWSRYNTLILPDHVAADDRYRSLLQAHLEAGGKILATGRSGLDANGEKFVFEKYWGCRYAGKCSHDPAYFKLTGKYAQELPDLPLALNTRCEKIEAADQNNVAGILVAPHSNKQWDGVYSIFYAPPERETDEPFLLLGKQCAYTPFALFESYSTSTTPDLRKLVEIMLRHLEVDPLVRNLKHLPSTARAFVSQKSDMQILHLFNYVPELRGASLMVEDALPLGGIQIRMKTGGRKVKKLYLAPEQTVIDFTEHGQYIDFTVPESFGYAMIVADLA